eukprot:TRINITY_DN32955_c0_g2_i1.p2 TRINITY_DN32955_c0_g2~~TRINITY_DN32955_c0_g2_i1.p2  ORF type:complete len:101 (-),score=15.08 TRINITY_DN32955_c0_g2_i1:296-598(-)
MWNVRVKWTSSRRTPQLAWTFGGDGSRKGAARSQIFEHIQCEADMLNSVVGVKRQRSCEAHQSMMADSDVSTPFAPMSPTILHARGRHVRRMLAKLRCGG